MVRQPYVRLRQNITTMEFFATYVSFRNFFLEPEGQKTFIIHHYYSLPERDAQKKKNWKAVQKVWQYPGLFVNYVGVRNQFSPSQVVLLIACVLVHVDAGVCLQHGALILLQFLQCVLHCTFSFVQQFS